MNLNFKKYADENFIDLPAEIIGSKFERCIFKNSCKFSRCVLINCTFEKQCEFDQSTVNNCYMTAEELAVLAKKIIN